MYTKSLFGLTILGCAMNSVSAVLGTFGAAAVGSSAALSFTALGAGSATSTLFVAPAGAAVAVGGALLLKALVSGGVGADLLPRLRRSTSSQTEQQTDLMINAIVANEPEACYRRLVCDLATGSMPKTSGDVILSLFETEVDATSPRFDLMTAAKLGKELKNVQFCEYRYSCPLTGEALAKIFN